MEDCCELFGGGVARGVEVTDWEALKEPIWDWEKASPLAEPMLP